MNFNNDSSDLETRAIKTSERLSEMVRMVCNEPALALFRIQEHTKTTLPLLLHKKKEVHEMQKDIQGSVFDADYALKAIKSISTASPLFATIDCCLKSALYNKQQLRHNSIKHNMLLQHRREQSRSSRITPLSSTNITTLTNLAATAATPTTAATTTAAAATTTTPTTTAAATTSLVAKEAPIVDNDVASIVTVVTTVEATETAATTTSTTANDATESDIPADVAAETQLITTTTTNEATNQISASCDGVHVTTKQ